jgi:hypothetical protein
MMAGMLAMPEAGFDGPTQDQACGEARMERLEAHVAYLSRQVAHLRASNAALEAEADRHSSAIGGLSRIGRAVHIDADGDLVFRGINVRIESGSSPWATPSGKGNLIIGYGTADEQVVGEHNLVIGGDHAVSARRSLVVGSGHTVTGTNAVALGGVGSEVGSHSAVLGGIYNGAIATSTVIVGGRDVWVHGERTVAIGGQRLDIDAKDSLILAGD